MEIILLVLDIVIILTLIPVVYKLFKNEESLRKALERSSGDQRAELSRELRENRAETSGIMQGVMSGLADIQKQTTEMQDTRLRELTGLLGERQAELNRTVDTRLEGFKTMVDGRLAGQQADNAKKLDEMRAVVDEKLQETLEKRIGESFKQVSERLEQVHKGLGEMQNLAVGVGDLKKVLSRVKSRGTLGEVQLRAILEDVMSPSQYVENYAPEGGRNFVEFAVRLPGADDNGVYLPIDSKFPGDTYEKLCDAYDGGIKAEIDAESKNLVTVIKKCAKDINEKYISPPYTTEFAVMFLPFEGLYAEVVRLGMVELLQRDYKITLAGPTTMAAILNALQMGFRTLAIQKRAGEVWSVLGAIKTEFGKFSDAFDKFKDRLDGANKELDSIVGTRTRMFKRQLEKIEALPEIEAENIFKED